MICGPNPRITCHKYTITYEDTPCRSDRCTKCNPRDGGALVLLVDPAAKGMVATIQYALELEGVVGERT